MTHTQHRLYPLTSNQREICFDQMLHPSVPLYNIGGYLQIDGAVDPKLFEQAINFLVQRHDALRTVLVQSTEEMPKQTFLEDLPVKVKVHDFSGEKNPRQSALTFLQQQFVQPFDLYEKPLFHFALLKIDKNCFFCFEKYHHLIVDGWSISLMNQSFTTIYTQLIQCQNIGRVAPSYLAFVKNDRAYIESERYQTHRQYWLEKYQTLPEPLFAPHYLRQFVEKIPPSECQVLWLPRPFYNRLLAFAKRTQSTLFHVMLGALYVYFTRTTQREELAIGLPVLNRSNANFKETVGLFIGVSAARFQFGTKLSFRQLLKAIVKALKSDYRHQRLPISELNHAVGIEKMGRQLFDIQLNYAKHDHDTEFGGFKVKSITIKNNNEQTPLSISVWEFHENENVPVDFVYNLAYFNSAEIERIQSRFVLILEYVLNHVDDSIRTIPLLTDTEQQQLLAWNQTKTDYPKDQTIIDLFQAQVEKTPENIAVVFEEQQLSYRALNTKANQLAHDLMTLEVSAETLVGICVERSLEMVIGLLGILKAGGAYVPLDPDYPQERLQFMLEDSAVPVLLSQSHLRPRLPVSTAFVVFLDSDWEQIAGYSGENPVRQSRPENLAYVIYTSGSTGVPKGVMVTHKGFLNLTIFQKQLFNVTAESHIMQFASLSFDATCWELAMAIPHGAEFHLSTADKLLPSNTLITLLKERRISHITLPPSALTVLPQETLPHLQFLVVAGEACSSKLVEKWSRERKFINAYGPTESTVCATLTECQADGNSPPIGKPISNTQIYILDANHNPTPLGIPGELCIAGAGLARGYLNRPELTSEKFIEIEVFGKPQRLYKTGDLARWLPDGNIEYLGRLDHQVKIRGFRIELGEIEAVLGQHPNVQQTVVIMREDQPGNQRLVAYLVSDLIPERIPYQTECLAKWNGNTLKLHTEDISNSGVLLGNTVTFDEGQKLSLHLLLPGESDARWLKGKVAWLQKTSWTGIEFMLTPNEQTILNQSIEYLLETQGLLKILQRLLTGNLRNYLKEKLPHYMVPSHFVLLNTLPLTPNGKIDRSKLSAPVDSPKQKSAMPQTEAEQQIAIIWQEVLSLDKVGIHENFFDLGGHSLLIIQVQTKLQIVFAKKISVVELFEHPTIHALAQHLGQTQCTPEFIPESQPNRRRAARPTSNEIAIIGMSGRFPGATDIEAFWPNLQHGVESISFFSDEELIASGIESATLKQPNYVKASAVLSNIELFDAAFFDVSPREAEMTDPQHRIFLECAWESLENSGYALQNGDNVIGVYAGVGMDTYLLNNLYPNRDALTDTYSLMICNEKDFLSTHVSYKLNLRGPSIDVQTACSTSLVAVHLACQSLLDGECDMALAGGVSITLPQKAGYLYQEGMIHSPDGHCRAFDAKAKGTVGGNGVGIVVLKKLEQAIADGDPIHAVIKGSAVNNDGFLKVGYTAPSVEGQAAVISKAQAVADIETETISYIEAHGTGTELGDPIEIAALTKAFRATTDKNGFCAIGSLKTNIGHTDTAAGVAGLIKTVLALKHRLLPPSLHFDKPNPQIDFANSPFYVNRTLSEWKSNGTPRRAGVSSFGIGGTNAHVILEEAPAPEPSEPSRPWQLLVLSAKTSSALDTTAANYANYLAQHPDINLADVAYTLHCGRQSFKHRRMLVCQNNQEAATALRTLDPKCVFTYFQPIENRPVVFMFSGQGAQYVNMGYELYQTESLFREEVDKCSDYLKPHLGLELRQILYPIKEKIAEATHQINQTAITQSALFVIEYALAKLWMSYGIHPAAMIGHSIGEYVAACLANVFSLEDALSLVAARGQMMQSVPKGAMLAVLLPESEVYPLLHKGLSLAAINNPRRCVVSGLIEAVEALQNQLTQQGVECRRLQTSHAFHSEMMNPILAAFTDRVKQVTLNPPQIPYVSNVTGNCITAAEVTNPNYWASHLRQTVRFAEGLQRVLEDSTRILLEVGPGRTLSTLAKQHPDKRAEHSVLSSLRHPHDNQSDVAFLLNTLGQFWLVGGSVNCSGFYANERRHRLPLPTYPFERQRYWIEPPKQHEKTSEVSKLAGKNPDIADWFYVPYWKPSVLPAIAEQKNLGPWLVFEEMCGFGSQLVKKLEQQGKEIITVKIGSAFARLSDQDYALNPQLSSDYEALVKALRNRMPQMIVHLWSVTHHSTLEGIEIEKAQDLGFYSLLFLAQALGKQNVTDEIQIAVVSNHMQAVTGEEVLHPEKATVLGPVKVIGQEYPNLTCRSIDIPLSENENDPKLIAQLQAELTSKSSDQVIAYRGEYRWVQTFEPVRLDKPIDGIPRLREKGVYLITGGLGGIGLTLAEHLAKTVQAKLILTGRSALPASTLSMFF